MQCYATLCCAFPGVRDQLLFTMLAPIGVAALAVAAGAALARHVTRTFLRRISASCAM